MRSFTVTWSDGLTSRVESSSYRFERHNSRLWWFFRFGRAIVAVRFPDDVYDALPNERNPRFAMLMDAMTTWARAHRSEEVTSELTLVASFENARLRVREPASP